MLIWCICILPHNKASPTWSRHWVPGLLSPHKGAQPASASLHFGEVKKKKIITKPTLRVFKTWRWTHYMQLTDHCEAAEGKSFGILASSGRSEHLLPKIHIPSWQNLFRQVFTEPWELWQPRRLYCNKLKYFLSSTIYVYIFISI